MSSLKKFQDFDEAVRSRMSGSVTATVLLMPIIITAYIWLVNISIFHPLNWISGSLYNTLSMSLWFYGFILAIIVVCISVTSWKHFTVSPVVWTSRFAHLYSTVHPESWLHGLGHGLASAVSAWLLSSIAGGRYTGMTAQCDNDSVTCMNEYHVFTVCYGFYAGVLYSIDFFQHQHYHITFPKVKQPRYFRVKNALLPTLVDTSWVVLRQIRYYYLLYWLCGGWLRGWISGSLRLGRSTVALDSIYGLLDVHLLWSTLLTGLVIRLCWCCGVVLYKIFITMPYHLPVETVMEGRTILVEALASSKSLLNYHGYWHLYHVSQFLAGERRILFSLSQPGGHPHNWTGVLTECQRQLTDLTQRINQYNDGSPLMRNAQTNDLLHKGTDISSTLTYRGSTVPETLVPPYDNIQGIGSKQQQQLTLVDKMLLDFRKKPAVAYFFSELPELLSRQLYASCQVQIWALEALSLLIESSLGEDDYGVVQKHVPEILMAMLALQEAVERHSKLGLNGRGRLAAGRRQDSDSALRTQLKQSLRTALYRITQTFNVHVRDFNLPHEYERRLENFLDYKE